MLVLLLGRVTGPRLWPGHGSGVFTETVIAVVTDDYTNDIRVRPPAGFNGFPEVITARLVTPRKPVRPDPHLACTAKVFNEFTHEHDIKLTITFITVHPQMLLMQTHLVTHDHLPTFTW